jgi:hypothetical protein
MVPNNQECSSESEARVAASTRKNWNAYKVVINGAVKWYASTHYHFIMAAEFKKAGGSCAKLGEETTIDQVKDLMSRLSKEDLEKLMAK